MQTGVSTDRCKYRQEPVTDKFEYRQVWMQTGVSTDRCKYRQEPITDKFEYRQVWMQTGVSAVCQGVAARKSVSVSLRSRSAILVHAYCWPGHWYSTHWGRCSVSVHWLFTYFFTTCSVGDYWFFSLLAISADVSTPLEVHGETVPDNAESRYAWGEDNTLSKSVWTSLSPNRHTRL